MEGNWAVSVMNMLDKITKLVFINLLWILFTLLGLGVFGLFPATASVNALVRKLIKNEELSNVFSHFWRYYRTSFKSANLVGITFLIIAFILYIDIRILFGTDLMLGKILLALLMMLSYILVATVLNFLPIYAKYQMKTIDYLKLSLVTAMTNPLTTLLMVFWLVIVGIICIGFTVVIPLLSIVLVSIGINWISIKKIETKTLFNHLPKK